MIKKIFVIMLLGLILQGCSAQTMKSIESHLPEKAMRKYKDILDNATPEFRRGWYDGCEVGAATGSVNTFYQMFYSNTKVDGYAKANDAEYRTGWGEAFCYCVRYEYIKQKSSLWGSMFGGYK